MISQGFIEKVQVDELVSHGWLPLIAKSLIPWLLMAWLRKEPRHEQSPYWTSSPGYFVSVPEGLTLHVKLVAFDIQCCCDCEIFSGANFFVMAESPNWYSVNTDKFDYKSWLCPFNSEIIRHFPWQFRHIPMAYVLNWFWSYCWSVMHVFGEKLRQ